MYKIKNLFIIYLYLCKIKDWLKYNLSRILFNIFVINYIKFEGFVLNYFFRLIYLKKKK